MLAVAFWLFGSTAPVRGLPLEASGRGGALLASEERFEGAIASLEGELGPRKGQ